MKLGRSIVRGLGVACFVLGGALLSIAVVSFAARPAYAQALSVNSIVVQGNQRVEADTIRSYFRPGPNGQLDAFQIDEGVKALISTGLFQDVRSSIQGGRLVITVTENPVINRIAFEGNKKVKDEQLKSEIQSKERGTLSRPVVQADTARIVEVYRRSGRFDVRVEPKIIELRIVSAVAEFDPTRNGFVITFTIEEGEQYRVGAVDVQSMIRSLDPSWLRVKLRIYPGDVYNAEAVEKTVEDMTIEAARQGFAFATVRPSATRDEQTRTVNVVFA